MKGADMSHRQHNKLERATPMCMPRDTIVLANNKLFVYRWFVISLANIVVVQLRSFVSSVWSPCFDSLFCSKGRRMHVFLSL